MRYRWAADLTSQVKVLSGIMTTFYLVNIIDVSALTIDLTPAQAAETLIFLEITRLCHLSLLLVHHNKG